MVGFTNSQIFNLNSTEELYNNVAYTSNRNGSPILVSVEILTERVGGRKFLVLEDLFMHSKNTAVGRVVSPNNTPNSQKGTGVFKKSPCRPVPICTQQGV